MTYEGSAHNWPAPYIKRTASGKYRLVAEGTTRLFDSYAEAEHARDDDGQDYEGPTCSICDGLHRGVCPLEDDGRWEPEQEVLF